MHAAFGGEGLVLLSNQDLASYPTRGTGGQTSSSHAVREMRRARMALHVTCHLRMPSMTTGERGDAETVTPRSEGGGRKRASNSTSSAPYPTWDICLENVPIENTSPSLLVRKHEISIQSEGSTMLFCSAYSVPC
jgi:hypothetical protein